MTFQGSFSHKSYPSLDRDSPPHTGMYAETWTGNSVSSAHALKTQTASITTYLHKNSHLYIIILFFSLMTENISISILFQFQSFEAKRRLHYQMCFVHLQPQPHNQWLLLYLKSKIHVQIDPFSYKMLWILIEARGNWINTVLINYYLTYKFSLIDSHTST